MQPQPMTIKCIIGSVFFTLTTGQSQPRGKVYAICHARKAEQKGKYDSSWAKRYPRVTLGTCLFCEKRGKIVIADTGRVCDTCLQQLTSLLKHPNRCERTKIGRCCFCPSRKLAAEFRTEMTGLSCEFRKGRKLVVGQSEASICDKCLDYCDELFKKHYSEKESFWSNLGPECGPEKCAEPGCGCLRIKVATFCLQHQYERAIS